MRPLSLPLLLESAGPVGRESRFSYLMAEPDAVLRAAPSPSLLSDARQLLGTHRRPAEPGIPPFQGGVAGYLSYEAGAALEALAPRADLVAGAVLGRYPWVVSWDRATGRAWLVDQRDDPAATSALLGRLGHAREAAPAGEEPPGADTGLPPSSFTRAGYLAAVARIRDYIRAGDVFQVNLTQRFVLSSVRDPMATYRRLRRLSPSAYAAYFDAGDHQVISSSPELFLSLIDGRIETRPIKGTRPRSDDPVRDEALARELAASEKDRAENVMIVDLLRNDLSRVADAGSVSVPSLLATEQFPTVHHLVSTVTARLAAGRDAFDLLAATLPGGSISGAPKVRAMQIIRELEPVARGAYCGAIGYIAWTGDMRMSVAIRTMVCSGGTVAVHAGGGVVIDSDPAGEFDESVVKARAMLQAAG